MDDSCAVCAEPLEWVAYGSCGHREVCSTCVVRLRFVLDDRRCCICKVESPTVFVTKALGDYTRTIADFSKFPLGASEGRVGDYWYHEDSQAYFDDVDHYKMIKAMCRLSCSVCENAAEEKGGKEGGKRRARFRNIEQMKGHLFHQHKLFMCSLCLEGRKVFITEQKLYTRAQLNRHISTGDSEVDGNESERGGFAGHPICEFCKSPFYGDNELYMHMSREHYTCHICQRQHPGHFDYFRNYDDLEIHFRQEHYLCEDEACLAEKFVVFQSESELKRHNAIKHGGHMSRSKRNAALKIPTSFRYRQNTAQEQRRGRGRFHSESSHQLASAIQASLEAGNTNHRLHDSSSSSGSAVSGHREISQVDAVANSFESLNVTPDSGPPSRSQPGDRQSGSMPIIEDSSFPALSDREPPESSFRYAQALGSFRGRSSLGQESFPPLPGVTGNAIQETRQSVSSFASKARGLSKSVPRASQVTTSRSAGAYGYGQFIAASSSQTRPARIQEAASSSSTSSSEPIPATTTGVSLPLNSAASHGKSTRTNRFASPSTANIPWNLNKTNKISHSSSAPDLVERGLSNNQLSDSNPPTPSGSSELVPGKKALKHVEDVQTANKSLVEKIRAALGMDEDRFSAFKTISAEYRQGLIGTVEYLSYVQQLGLSDLVIELARLCPDAEKQKELINTYHANLQYQNPRESSSSITSSKDSNVSRKGKGKSANHPESISSKDALTDSILNTVKKLQGNYKPQEEEVELLSKDGYRTTKGRGVRIDSSGQDPRQNGSSDGQNVAGGSSKQKKKTSKFQRVRLGDGSAVALFDLGRTDVDSDSTEEKSATNQSEGLPVRGVWKNGGGQRLISTSTRDPH